jgi:N-acetylmuramoyl-L-alanine amidase
MARSIAIDPSFTNLVTQQGIVRTKVNLNVRKGAPSSLVNVVRMVPANTDVTYQGWTSNGLSVNANPHWYMDGDGNYFWAGGTDHPVPGL